MRKLWLLAAPGIVAFAGCGQHPSVATISPTAQSTEIATASPVRRAIHYTVQQPGRIEPFEQTPIYTKIAGFVRSVHVEIGDRVKRGQLLVELEVPELVEAHVGKQALVNQARLGVMQAQRAVEVVQASLATAQAEIEVARAAHEKTNAGLQRWRSEDRRMEQLVKNRVVDSQSREEVGNQLRAADAANQETAARIHSAESTLAENRARLAKTKTDVDAASNQLKVAESDERQTRALLEYSRLTAPFDGVIADRQVHTGHFLNAATGSTTGHPLLVVVRTDKVRVFVEVPEADAVRVHAGDIGRVRVQTLNDREFDGKVTGTSWSLDETQRTLRTEIDLENPDGSLRPGMYVHSLIDLVIPDAWVVPASATLIRDGISFCYEVRDGKTHRLPVRLGLRDGKFVEVSKVQVPPHTPGDLPTWINPTGREHIIVTKPGELTDNQPVRTAQAKMPGTSDVVPVSSIK